MEEIFNTEVAIALKNGIRKMGLLIGEENDTAFIKYVPSEKTELYAQTKDPALVELLPSADINFIDGYLK